MTSALVEVRLHGELAKEFGKVWHLAIATPREAVQALEANTGKFVAKIRDLEKRGMVFRVRTKDHDYDNDDVGATLGQAKRVDFIPIVEGASAGVRFVVGAVLIAYGTFGQAYGGGPWATQLGAALILGSVVEWLTPVPRRPEDATKNSRSWTLSGPVDVVDQGYPVPVIYGEVLTDGYTISAGIATTQLNPAGTLAPYVAIGGEFTQALRTTTANPGGTAVYYLSAGPLNVDEPYTYTWGIAGIGAMPGVRLYDTDKSTCRVEIDFAGATIVNLTVDLQIDGRGAGTSGAETVIAVSASNSQLISLNVEVVELSTGG